MTMISPMSLAEQYAAAQAWWREAGVDYDFHDEAQVWLEEENEPREPARPEVEQKSEQASHAPIVPIVRLQDLPSDLSAFRQWWCDPASPIPGAKGTRIVPRGETGASLMVVAPSPEPGDRDVLLAGPQGRLIANITHAAGQRPETIYLATALPSLMAEPDWSELAAQGLGSVLVQHIALVQPQLVILFGRELPVLLGHPADAAPEAYAKISTPQGNVPVITSFAPDRLLGNARAKARLWQRLLRGMQ